jgi:hypothetical protein
MNKRFWSFHGLYWLIAGSALFASGLSQGPFKISLVRNLFFGVGGYVVGIALGHAFSRLAVRLRRPGAFLGACLGLSYVASTVMVALINPVTHAQRGVAFADLTWRHFMGGTMNYALVMTLWSLLYLFLFEPRVQRGVTKARERDMPEAAGSAMRIEVADGRQTRAVAVDDILLLRASGDYVEVVTSDKTYLKRSTLNALERTLGEAPFVRIHRSALVNKDRIKAVEAENKGRFELVMDNGERLYSSRTYRNFIAREVLKHVS